MIMIDRLALVTAFFVAGARVNAFRAGVIVVGSQRGRSSQQAGPMRLRVSSTVSNEEAGNGGGGGGGMSTEAASDFISERMAKLQKTKPRRYEDNADGVVYVNDKCINCAACSMFAPRTFTRSLSPDSRDEHWNGHHVVHRQPAAEDEILEARAALAACPVAAIRIETLAERRERARGTKNAGGDSDVPWTDGDRRLAQKMGLSPSKSGYDKPFPKPLFDDPDLEGVAYWAGHHNVNSFGGAPYLTKANFPGDDGGRWIMVDTPKFGPSAVEAVTKLTGPEGPDYLFLTHVDDTADHGKWKDRFPGLKRVFHEGDLGPYNWLNDESLGQVEVLLRNRPEGGVDVGGTDSGGVGRFVAYDVRDGSILPGDWTETTTASELPVVALHTPGHSPGSICLYRRPSHGSDEPGVLFTGDTYAFLKLRSSSPDRHATEVNGRMTAFPAQGRHLDVQIETLRAFLGYEWDIIAPGHGHPRDYRSTGDGEKKRIKREEEMRAAIDELAAAYEDRKINGHPFFST